MADPAKFLFWLFVFIAVMLFVLGFTVYKKLTSGGEVPLGQGMRSVKVNRAPSWLAAILWLAALLLIAATLIPVAESNRWWVRVLIFPQAQFTILLLLLAVAVPILLDMRWTATKLLLFGISGCLVYQLHYLLPYTPVWPVEARTARTCPAEDRLRVLVLNVREGNERADPVLALVREVRPDLFLAVETDNYWVRALRPLTAGLPNVVAAPRDSPWGLTLYSRLPLTAPEVRYLVEGYVPSIRAGVRLPSGAAIDFYGLHPRPPLMHGSAKGDAEVVRAAREIRASGRPAVLAGDLNDVPWGDAAQRMQEVGGLVDPRVGRAFDATFKAGNPLLRWPLDHVYVTPHFGIVDFEPLHDVGADHFPLLADLCLRANVRGAAGSGERAGKPVSDADAAGQQTRGGPGK